MRDLIERVEKLTGPDREVDERIICAVAAPAGAYVEQSRINGNWCIYVPNHRGEPKLWKAEGWWRAGGWPVTGSLDAAIALKERLLPGWSLAMLVGPERTSVFVRDKTLLDPNKIERDGYSASPAIALVLATLRAYAATHTAEAGK